MGNTLSLHEKKTNNHNNIGVASFLHENGLLHFDCRNAKYDNRIDKDGFCTYVKFLRNTNTDLNIIRIDDTSNADIICTILSSFMQHYYSNRCLNFDLSWCNLLPFFINDSFTNILNDINSSSSKVSPDYKIILPIPFNNHFSSILNNDNHDRNNDENTRAAICTALANCSLFSSWKFHFCKYRRFNNIYDETRNALKGLSQNTYIQELEIVGTGIPADIVFEAVADFLSYSKSLVKFKLMSFNINNVAATANLVEALIRSETITDLSFADLSFSVIDLNDPFFYNNAFFHLMKSLLGRKRNIQRLELDSTWNEADDEDLYPDSYVRFEASIFSQLLSNEEHYLRELSICFPTTVAPEQVRLFFIKLKDSYIEKLTIKDCQEDTCETLFNETIPYMSRLCNFYFNFNALSTPLQNVYVNSICKCSRTLSDVKDVKQVRNYIERNRAVTAYIEKKRNFPTIVLPRIVTVAKPTGPDATYQLLNNLFQLQNDLPQINLVESRKRGFDEEKE